VNCIVKENILIKILIDTCTDINSISQKYISELRITYYNKSNIIEMSNASYSTLGKINLYIIFNDSQKHKSISSEFIQSNFNIVNS